MVQQAIGLSMCPRNGQATYTRPAIRLLAAIAALVLCAGTFMPVHAQSAGRKPRYQKLDSVLNQLVIERTEKAADERAPAMPRPSLRQRGLVEYGDGQVGVTIRFSGPGLAIRDFVTSRGGHIAYTFDGAIEAYLDPAALPDLNALADVAKVDAIRRPESQVTSQGVQAHNAVPWQAAGYLGQGVKVGIIDGGFLGWSSLPPADAPSLGGVRCYVGGGDYYPTLSYCEADSDHGTAVAEAAHDIAPGATFYIANPYSLGDLHDAVQWMLQQGVRVINMSLAYDWDGPGNGTSPYADSPLKAVDAAVAGGAIVTISSGNYGQAAWFGPWQDADGDQLLDFAVGEPLTCLTAAAGERVTVEVRWQDVWGGASRDLDLWLYDYYGGMIADSSTDVQAGGPADVPHEGLSYFVTLPGLYCVAVERYAGTIPSWVQVRVASKQSLDFYNSATSVTNPAETANAGALAVGAANWQTTSTIEVFSGRGPTPDGRVKPDIVGVDQADSYTKGPNGFAGTSQSSPHVAGLAAIVAQGYAGYTPAQIASTLKSWALARGSVPNNTWGYGLAYLPTVYNLTVAKTGAGAGTVTSLDSRVNCGTSCVQTYFASATVTLTATAAVGSVFAGWSGGGCSGTGNCTVTMNAATQVTATFGLVITPVITWPAPAAIIYGTPLSATQLNATTGVPGTFVYTPPAGTVLNAGVGQTLSVLFTPTDTVNYTTATKTVTIDVLKAAPVITWPPPLPIVRGTPLGAQQLNAMANVPGTFVYTPGAGTVLPVGQHLLSAVFTPTDALNYQGAEASVSITVVGTTVGDFDGDGTSDILWRHNTQGDMWLWPLVDAARAAETYVRTVADAQWEIRGLGDQTGDGQADILWRHAPTGLLYLWTMNGGDVVGDDYVGTVEPAYAIVGTADYTGDGRTDILWRHATTGQLWLWEMNGPTSVLVSYVDTVDMAYSLVGSGDLDGDGKADLVWRGTAGDVWVWLMNGPTRKTLGYVATVSEPEYEVAVVADYSGDGKADLLWRHATRGELWVWTMAGTSQTGVVYVATVGDTGYRVVGHGDYDGDGQADLLWHHATRGEVWVWLMDGTTKTAQEYVGTVPDTGYRIVR
jgi:hypothetical protein